MSAKAAGGPVAILAGGGALPGADRRRARCAGSQVGRLRHRRRGGPGRHSAPVTVHAVRWGELGRVLQDHRSGRLHARPSSSVASRGGPISTPSGRISAQSGSCRASCQLMRGGDDSLLVGLATIFEEHGVAARQPARRCAGAGSRRRRSRGRRVDGRGARRQRAGRPRRRAPIGRLDIGQAAVAIGRTRRRGGGRRRHRRPPASASRACASAAASRRPAACW